VIRQVTTDHTWVQEAIENGALTLEEARSHPNAHVIRRYLGSKVDVVPDTRIRLKTDESDQNAEANQGLRLQEGDTVLLCSDGLTDLVNDQEIQAALLSEDLDSGLERLINQANGRGGHDNITMVALRMPIAEPLAQTAPIAVAAPSRRFRLGASCLAAGLLLALILLTLGGFFYFTNRSKPTPTFVATNNPAIQSTLFIQVTRTFPLSTSPSPSGPASSTPTIFRPVGGTRSAPSAATLTPWPTNTKSP
jgi:protein phosphatase